MYNKNMKKFYICGPTVYNDPHIGNLRAITAFDLSLKAMRFLGQEFIFVHNITDIDDKIINKAIECGVSETEIATKYTKQYFDLLKILNIDTITYVEKVTDNIGVIDEYIAKLVNNGSAYRDQDNNVWFDVNKHCEQYGVVSGQKLDKMVFEEESNYKHFPADFALWKSTKVGIKYDSRFGQGRPGWHTECCALIDKHFGSDGVDVHGGGMDLTFPHHENENIQHFALHNQNIAKNWIRVGQINLNGIKMSKSLGNVILPQEFFKIHGSEIYKLMILTAKFSAPINLTEELINNLKAIEAKYKKVMFQIYSKFGTNLEPNNKHQNVLNMFDALSNYDFAKYNLLINDEIKQFNKTKSIENALNIYTVFHIIHRPLTDVSIYKNALDLFAQWHSFLSVKDYSNADLLREKLQKTGLY